ncbi:MAG: DinB family protein [Terriglobales bacterium]
MERMGDNILCALVYGKGAHVAPVACVEDISAELAAQTGADYPHSIWQIAEHMNYWMDYDLGKVAGENRPYPEQAIESWPAHPNPSLDRRLADERWQVATRRFTDLLARVARLAESDAAELARKVQCLGPAQSRRESTVHAILWQIAAHNSYHAGQIALLRRQFGAWPPRRGGDTW